ncbi:MAG: ATP-binding cassette domain-containing protein [Deltaproteobacteria bacterium]|nr:ATP-binding cassette domain-containing protein [Deltaproteobacteria bacterium]
MSIVLRGVQHDFGRFSLGPVDLEVEGGAYAVVLGPTGSGKSLLLKTVAGVLEPARGQVRLEGRDVTEVPAERRACGFVFQESSLFPHLTVPGNIAYGLRVAGTPRAETRARVDELVARLDLGRLIDRPVHALSGGEAQKVALARALARRPRILLLDEPLSQVDSFARAELQEVLARLHAELALTTLHVTHSFEEARALGDACAVMLGGRIVQRGSVDEVFARPACAFVARFLGCEAAGGRYPDPPGCSQTCLAGTGRCDRPDLAAPERCSEE